MPDPAFGNGECLVAGHERTSSSKPMITPSSFLRTLGRSALVALLVPAAAGAQAPMRGTTPPQAAGHRLGVPRAVAVERHVGGEIASASAVTAAPSKKPVVASSKPAPPAATKTATAKPKS